MMKLTKTGQKILVASLLAAACTTSFASNMTTTNTQPEASGQTAQTSQSSQSNFLIHSQNVHLGVLGGALFESGVSMAQAGIEGGFEINQHIAIGGELISTGYGFIGMGNAYAKFMLPINSRVRLYAKAGASYDTLMYGLGGIGGTSAMFGGGADFAVQKHVTIGLDYERYQRSGFGVNSVTLDAAYHFGA